MITVKTGGKEEPLEEKKGFLCVSQQNCQRLQEKQPGHQKTGMYGKATMKAGKEHTETGKISEIKKDLQAELVTLELHNTTATCTSQSVFCLCLHYFWKSSLHIQRYPYNH